MLPRKRSAAGDVAEGGRAKRAALEDPQATLAGGNKTQSKMAQFWREGKFCDISIRVDGQEFRAHRVVLAAGSEMLAALSDGERFADSTSSTIELQDIGAAAFQAVLSYLYDGTVDCAMSLLTEVGAAASYLQVTPLVEQASNALKAGLSATNCVTAWSFAKLHSMDDLVAACREKAVDAFLSLKDVDCLPREEMRGLLASDDLGVDHEQQVYEMAVRYARAQEDLPRSDVDLASFFSGVRFPLLAEATFKTVVMNEPLLAGARCQSMLASAYAAVVYGHAPVARGALKTAADAKARGLSAADAKRLAVPGVQIFALCKTRDTANNLQEGIELVLSDGKFGKAYARDRDGKGPWHVVLDGTNVPTGKYHTGVGCYKNYRFLDWA